MVPPLVGVAVNFTEVPAQIAPDGTAAIVTLAGRFGFTVIVIPSEVAGEEVRHGVAFEFIITVITSPFANVVEIYSGPVADGMKVPPFFQM